MNETNPWPRRCFLKSLVTAPLMASGLRAVASQADSLKRAIGHHFKISLNVYSFNALLREGKIDLFDVLEFCAAYNFEAIDPTGYYFPAYPEVPTLEFINQFKRKAFLLGLDISGTGVRNDFTVTDPARRQADVAMIKQWIEAAAGLGIPNLRVFAGTTPHEGYTRDQVFDWMARDVKACCEHGRQFGVIVAIQNHNDFLKTAADVDRMFNMVDSDWLGLNLDIGSYRQGDPYQEIKQNIKYAVTWQIKENVWIEGKEVPTDFVRLFKLIKAAGYRGYLPLETLGAGDPYIKVPRLLDQVQQALTQI